MRFEAAPARFSRAPAAVQPPNPPSSNDLNFTVYREVNSPPMSEFTSLGTLSVCQFDMCTDHCITLITVSDFSNGCFVLFATFGRTPKKCVKSLDDM